MPINHASTIFDVLMSSDPTADSYRPGSITWDVVNYTQYPNGIRAHMSRLARITGGADELGGEQLVAHRHALSDPIPDTTSAPISKEPGAFRIRDRADGQVYAIVYIMTRNKLTFGVGRNDRHTYTELLLQIVAGEP